MIIKKPFQDDPRYPPVLKKSLADKAPALITAIGNLDLLQNKTLAIFNSSKCQGQVILQTYDLKNIKSKWVNILLGCRSERGE